VRRKIYIFSLHPPENVWGEAKYWHDGWTREATKAGGKSLSQFWTKPSVAAEAEEEEAEEAVARTAENLHLSAFILPFLTFRRRRKRRHGCFLRKTSAAAGKKPGENVFRKERERQARRGRERTAEGTLFFPSRSFPPEPPKPPFLFWPPPNPPPPLKEAPARGSPFPSSRHSPRRSLLFLLSPLALAVRLSVVRGCVQTVNAFGGGFMLAGHVGHVGRCGFSAAASVREQRRQLCNDETPRAQLNQARRLLLPSLPRGYYCSERLA
jgi:hypothetical protein